MRTGGGYRLRAYTRNANSLIRECTRKRIGIENLKRHKEYIEFNIKSSDYETVNAILNAFSIDFQRVSYYGGARTIDLIKRRAFMIVGLIIGLMMVFIASQFVYKVEINGNNRYNGVIERVLIDSGISGVMYKGKLDTDALELKIVECIPEVTNATVYIDGAVLKVTTVTNETPSVPVGADARVLSAYQAIITRIYVSSGTANVSVGDSVKKGDTLIEGHINTNKEDYQESSDGNYVPVEAKGEVFGKVYYHKRVVLTDTAVISEYTGNVEKRRDLYIGNMLIGKPHKKPFENYSSSVSYDTLSFILPLKVVTTVYRETAERVVDRTEYREWLLEKADEELTLAMPMDAVITNKEIIEVGDTIDIYYEAEHRIDMR